MNDFSITQVETMPCNQKLQEFKYFLNSSTQIQNYRKSKYLSGDSSQKKGLQSVYTHVCLWENLQATRFSFLFMGEESMELKRLSGTWSHENPGFQGCLHPLHLLIHFSFKRPCEFGTEKLNHGLWEDSSNPTVLAKQGNSETLLLVLG